jgi:WD40 repeat protein/AAA+ ATPase superfamily predicted ATPase
MPDERLKYFDDLVLKSRNRPLNDGEKYVLRGIWTGKSYEEMVADSQGKYSKNYLMQSCGPKILKTIGQELKLPLSKGNFRATVEKHVELPTNSQIAQPNSDSEEATEIVPSQLAGLKTDRYLNREFEVTLGKNFYGRKKERERLSDSVENRRRRLTILTALPGMGKSFLAYLLVQQQIELKNFDLIIYFALERQEDPLTAHDLAKDILDNCFIGYDPHNKNPIEELARCFKTHRCLLVIDNFDVVFSVQNKQLLTFAEDDSYKQLIERLTFKPHQSHTVIVSRVFPQLNIRELSAVHSIDLIPLEGMGFKDVESFLNSQGVDNITEDNIEELTEYLGGMPAAIATAISDMKEYHANKLKEFLASKSISKNVKAGIEKIFGDLLSAEEELLDRMISYGRPVSYPELEQDIKDIKKLGDERATAIFKNLKSIIDSLRGRSLIQSDDSPRYYIHPVVANIRLQFIIDQVVEEIQSPSGEMNYLNRFVFYKPASEESDLARQKENVFKSIVKKIEESCQKKEIQECLQKISKPNDNYYAAGNIFNILCELDNGNLDDTNFEYLVIRHADARVVSSMQNVSDLKDGYITTDNKIHLPVNEGNVNPSRLGCPDAIAFSPTEDRFAVGDADGNVRLWRYDNRNWVEEDRVFGRHAGWIWSIKYCPNGKFILTGGDDGVVYLWNANSKKHDPFVKLDLGGAIVSVAFSPDFCCDPDGNNQGLIAACNEDGTIKIWDVSNYFAPIDLSTGLIKSKPKYIEFLPQKESDLTEYTLAIVSSDNKGLVGFWSSPKSKNRSYNFTKTKEDLKHDLQIATLKFSPNGDRLAVGAVDGSVSLWSVAQGKKIANCPKKHDKNVGAIDFDKDGKILASAGHDGKIILWNLENIPGINEHPAAHKGKILGIAFSQETGVLVSVSDDRTIKIWPLDLKADWEQEILENSQLIKGSTKWIWSLTTHPQEPIFAAACDDGRVVILEQLKGEKLEKRTTLITDSVRTWAVAFHPKGKILATGGADKNLKLWDWSASPPTQLDEDLKGHDDPIRSIAFSADADGKVIATASGDGTVRLWELIDEDRGMVELVTVLKNSDKEVWTVAFGLGDKLLAQAGENGKIYLRYFENGTEDILKVYKPDYKNKPEPIIINAHDDTIWSICFSPDGQYLASASSDRTIRLWNVKSKRSNVESKILLSLNPGEQIERGDRDSFAYTLNGIKDHLHAVAFSSDSKFLAATGNDRTIRVWEISKLKKGEKNLPIYKSDENLDHNHTNWVWALAWHPSEPYIISGSLDGKVKLWDEKLNFQCEYSNQLFTRKTNQALRDERSPP